MGRGYFLIYQLKHINLKYFLLFGYAYFLLDLEKDI